MLSIAGRRHGRRDGGAAAAACADRRSANRAARRKLSAVAAASVGVRVRPHRRQPSQAVRRTTGGDFAQEPRCRQPMVGPNHRDARPRRGAAAGRRQAAKLRDGRASRRDCAPRRLVPDIMGGERRKRRQHRRAQDGASRPSLHRHSRRRPRPRRGLRRPGHAGGFRRTRRPRQGRGHLQHSNAERAEPFRQDERRHAARGTKRRRRRDHRARHSGQLHDAALGQWRRGTGPDQGALVLGRPRGRHRGARADRTRRARETADASRDRIADRPQAVGGVRRAARHDGRKHPGHRPHRRLLGSGGRQRVRRRRDAGARRVFLEDPEGPAPADDHVHGADWPSRDAGPQPSETARQPRDRSSPKPR